MSETNKTKNLITKNLQKHNTVIETQIETSRKTINKEAEAFFINYAAKRSIKITEIKVIGVRSNNFLSDVTKCRVIGTQIVEDNKEKGN